MTSVNVVTLLVGVLLLLGIASSKFSARLGMPVLVFFLAVGMLAGSEGIGRIAFEDYALANNVGSAALAIILFDGGLRTSLSSVYLAWRPALALATVGVLLTAAITGAAAAWILGIPLLHGLLLGGIVGSTDAAAVFSVLRTSGLKLPTRLTATLEVESGSNDPMAIFLTLALIGVIMETGASAGALVLLFTLQFGVGALVGIGVGRGAAWAVNQINLEHSGLYPILVMAFGLLAFGLAAVLGGSGFLAVYMAGIIIGSSPIVFKRGIFLFHDAMAWLSQIGLFIMLGLLSFPSRLLAIAGSGFLIALVLIFVARPLAVLVSAAWFRFHPRELIFLSWVGLKGAVPITLATFPLMAGVPGSEQIFNIVFFVVLVSAITQGWSLPMVARRLRLGEPTIPPPLTVEINALRHVDGEIVDYTVAPGARASGHTLRHLAFPTGVGATLLVREREVIIPRGTTMLLPGDHVYLAMHSRLKPFIDHLFAAARDAEPPQLTAGQTFSFHVQSTAEQVRYFFDLPDPKWPAEPLLRLLETSNTASPARLGPFELAPNKEADVVTLTVV